jgi:thiaminase
LDQIREIVSVAPQMAHTLTALERCYQGYRTFLDVMMGLDHQSSLPYREFVNTFQGLKQARN